MTSAKRVAARFAARTSADAKVTRHLGLCGYCEKQQKVQSNQLVLHGYKRPGSGYAEGRCRGVGHPPYEVSPITSEIALKDAEGQIKSLKADIKGLQTDPDNVIVMVWKGRQPTPQRLGDMEFRSPYQREDTIKSALRTAQANLSTSESMRDHFQDMVRGWKAVDMITVEEDVRKKQDLKTEREQKKVQDRIDKYEAGKAKLLERVESSFKKLEEEEAKFKRLLASGDRTDDFKLLYKVHDLAKKMTDRHRGLVYALTDTGVPKLREVAPQGMPKEAIYRDLGIDPLLRHIGVLDGNSIVKPETSYGDFMSQEEARTWLPKWPGYKR